MGHNSERLAALFFLGVVLFNPPLLDLVDTADIAVFGVPLLYAYLFAAWALLIALTAAVVERQRRDDAPPGGPGEDKAGPGSG